MIRKKKKKKARAHCIGLKLSHLSTSTSSKEDKTALQKQRSGEELKVENFYAEYKE